MRGVTSNQQQQEEKARGRRRIRMGEMVGGIQLGVIGALFLSVASSVSIVICNKALMSNLGFPFATTLTSWHLVVTFCTLYVAHRFNLFESKSVDTKTVILFGLLNGVSIGFLNLSLGFNSIGFYQLTNTIQKRLNVSSTQLLYQSAPYQAAILFVTGPLVDQFLTKKNVFAYKYNPLVVTFIMLSCLIAVAVNFSTFMVIGKTSPVTYQVLGHLKTCLVLLLGYTLLHDPFSYRNIVGILVAMAGMVLYSYFCTQEGKKKLSVEGSQVKEKEEDVRAPLMGVQEKENVEAKKLAKDSIV
ncbi:UDP-xylose transporter 1 [Linum perenne]